MLESIFAAAGQEEMRALQQKISQQSSPASPPPPLPPTPLVTSGPGEEQLSIAEMVARGIGAARQDPAAHPGAGAGERLFDGRRNSNPSLRGATALGADGGVGTEAAAAVPRARVVQVEGGSAVAEAPATTTQRADGDAGAVPAAGLKGGEFSSVTAAAGAPAAPGHGGAQREVRGCWRCGRALMALPGFLSAGGPCVEQWYPPHRGATGRAWTAVHACAVGSFHASSWFCYCGRLVTAVAQWGSPR